MLEAGKQTKIAQLAKYFKIYIKIDLFLPSHPTLFLQNAEA